MKSAVTLFSWGYEGWGTSTRRLVKYFDEIEARRGFNPPVFVDTRLHRKGRAPGFVDDAFEHTVGTGRYRWMKWLGNENHNDEFKPNKISYPDGVESLIDLAMVCARERRRVIFFCHCERIMIDGEPKCHRCNIATLAIAAMTSRGIEGRVIEWPGAEPKQFEVEISRAAFRKLRRGCKNIPLPRSEEPARFAGPPCGSLVRFRCGEEFERRIVRPIVRYGGNWCLPVMPADEDAMISSLKAEAARLRASEGWVERRA